MGRNVAIIGVPMDLGAGRRGVDMGPSAIRYAGVAEYLMRLGHQVEDLGDLPVDHAGRAFRGQDLRLHYLEAVRDLNLRLAGVVSAALGAGKFPLVLGGDHSIAIGALAGAARSSRRPSVLWFDAHADFNTHESTPSGNIHGMPLAASVGRGHPSLLDVFKGAPFIEEGLVSLVGVRELDGGERDALKASHVHVATMADLDRRGMDRVVEEALLMAKDSDHLHVSFDLDVMDPKEAPGVGTPHAGGITYREAHLALEMVAASGKMASMSIVEVNPILDLQNATGNLAAELVASAFGQSIL